MGKEMVLAKNRSKEEGERAAGRGLSHRERRAQVAKAWTQQTRLALAGKSRSLFPG